MPSDRAIGGAVLGIDTSGPWCCAAVIRGDTVLAHQHQDMSRGQGEALMPLIEEVLARAAIGWSDLGAIGVGTGPGNFTGIRISVSAARGLALGLGIPAIGVDRFEAAALDGPALPVAVPAFRGQVWVQHPGAAPELRDMPTTQVPPGQWIGIDGVEPVHPLAVAIARLADKRRHGPQPRPKPRYLREADAAPPAQAPPMVMD